MNEFKWTVDQKYQINASSRVRVCANLNRAVTLTLAHTEELNLLSDPLVDCVDVIDIWVC